METLKFISCILVPFTVVYIGFQRVFWNDFNMKCSYFVTIYLPTAQYQAIPKSNVSVKFTDILVCLISLHSFF